MRQPSRGFVVGSILASFLAYPGQSSLQETLVPTGNMPQMVFLSFVRGSFALFRHEWFLLKLLFMLALAKSLVDILPECHSMMYQFCIIYFFR